MSPARALVLAFGPDADQPLPRAFWGLLVAAVALPVVGWLLGEDDEPNDLGGDES